MKDTFYFPHDYNPRSDDKIKPLLRKHGMTGYGIFWSIIEDLYINANALRMDYECIAFELRVDENIVKSIINDFNLFQISGDYFGSLSVERRLNERAEKSAKARGSANKRWDDNAKALRAQSECNAKKEKKVKEKKEIKEDKNTTITWKESFEVYLSELRIFYEDILTNKEWVDRQETYYPYVDIYLSLEKMCLSYWATEDAWNYKKKQKTVSINWKRTIENSLSDKRNQVRKPYEQPRS